MGKSNRSRRLTAVAATEKLGSEVETERRTEEEVETSAGSGRHGSRIPDGSVDPGKSVRIDQEGICHQLSPELSSASAGSIGLQCSKAIAACCRARRRTGEGLADKRLAKDKKRRCGSAQSSCSLMNLASLFWNQWQPAGRGEANGPSCGGQHGIDGFCLLQSP